MIQTKRWQTWKWGVAAVLSIGAIVVVFFLQQYDSYQRAAQYWSVAGEPRAGLAAGYSAETTTTAFMVEPPPPGTPPQESSGPMIIRTVSLKLTSTHLNDI